MCMDVPGNGDFGKAPCNRVELGIKLGLAGEAAVWLVANALAWRSRRVTWATRLLVPLYFAVFLGAVAIEASY